MEDKLKKVETKSETPKTFSELFKNTGIEPKEDINGNITYSFKAVKK
jgi:hypothetical protein